MKIAMRLTRGLGSGLDYFLTLPLTVLREEVECYVEVLEEDAGEK